MISFVSLYIYDQIALWRMKQKLELAKFNKENYLTHDKASKIYKIALFEFR